MCQIIYKPAGKEVPEERLKAAFELNPDGFGVMWLDKNGTSRYWKQLVKDFADVKKRMDALKECEAGIHFRIRTHGAISQDQSHPYVVFNTKDHGRALWLMHNGIISFAPEVDKSKSDTWHFIHYILRPVLLHHPKLLDEHPKVLDDMIGTNKLLLLDVTTRTFKRVNSTLWVEEDGIFYSNRLTFYKRGFGYIGYSKPYKTSEYWWDTDTDPNHQRRQSNLPAIITAERDDPFVSGISRSEAAHAQQSRAFWSLGNMAQYSQREVVQEIIGNPEGAANWLNSLWRMSQVMASPQMIKTHLDIVKPAAQTAFTAILHGSKPHIEEVMWMSWADILGLISYPVQAPHVFALRPCGSHPGPWQEVDVKDLGPIITCNFANKQRVVAFNIWGTRFRKDLKRAGLTVLGSR